MVRYPELYYIERLKGWCGLALAAGFVAFIALWFLAEPALISGRLEIWALAGLAFVLILALLTRLAMSEAVGRRVAHWVPRPALHRHTAGWGLLLTLIVYTIRWNFSRRQPIRSDGLRHSLRLSGGDTVLANALRPADDAPTEPAPLVVLVQLESFLDPERYWPGLVPMPGLAEARSRARLYGPLRVQAQGAYTMRSEFAMLTGLGQDELGFEGFDPYLSATKRVTPSLAFRFSARGYRTVFLHPFKSGFFGRDKVMPALGFREVVMEDGFVEAERFGPYVSDEALAERIIAEANAGDGPAFIFAVTMENHGPWGPGRLAETDDPAEQYRIHLGNTDWLIHRLVTGLATQQRRVVLCLFGDHPPILRGVAELSAAPETDYILLDLATASDANTELPLDLASLHHALGLLAGLPPIRSRSAHAPSGR